MLYARVENFSARAFSLHESEETQQLEKHPASVLNAAYPYADLHRLVYCVLGMPIDAVGMSQVLSRIEAAAVTKTRCLISTVNLDFLVQTRSDSSFHETLLESDLCTADGMPIVWVGRFLGVPITGRVSGSDLLEMLKSDAGNQPLNVFLFGGGEGVSEAAGLAINMTSQRLKCVGTLNPGFGDIAELSRPQHIQAINASKADFLVASLGAKKGQLWLYQNRDHISVPIRAHLGAAVSFMAGTVKRAPRWCRNFGLEWLWRIKEEPYLWRRYAGDGIVALKLLWTNVLPLWALNRFDRSRGKHARALTIEVARDANTIVKLTGAATDANVTRTIEAFEEALSSSGDMVLDFAKVDAIDARFLGLILMARKLLHAQGRALRIVKVSRSVRHRFQLHGAQFLLPSAA
jgi:N-acetylglucosaminyldiphosphoundecaprenol N-acetyl-beta-D-mannosaminyltransferase